MENSDQDAPVGTGQTSARVSASAGAVRDPSTDRVRAFLPVTQLERIVRIGPTGDRTRMEPTWGAVLTIDVSGFSVLAERHAREGSRGIEALSEIVHDLFGTLTRSVLERVGDVLYHAGDAVCAGPAGAEGRLCYDVVGAVRNTNFHAAHPNA